MLSEQHTWNILGDHFKRKGFVHHQTESFNHFLNVGIPKIVTEEPDIVITSKNNKNDKNDKNDKNEKFKSYRVSFSDIHIPFPTVTEETRELRGFYPSEARQRDLTYDSPIYATITETLELETGKTEVTRHLRVVLGRIPIMLRSSKCYLSNMTPNERIQAGECEYDEGGYFIIKGKERVLVAQLRGIYNVTLVLEQKTTDKIKYIAEMRSMSEETGHSVLIQAMIGSDNRTLVFQLPYVKDAIPIGVVFKAMGYKAEQFSDLIGLKCDTVNKYIRLIINDSFFVEDDGVTYYIEANQTRLKQEYPLMKKEDIPNHLFDEWNKLDPEEQLYWQHEGTKHKALKHIGAHSIHTLKEHERLEYAKQVVNSEIFPHMGVTSTIQEKGYLLGHMVHKLLATHIGIRKPDDRDNYINKRVDSSGILCHDLFRQLFKKYTCGIITAIDKRKQLPDVMSIIPRQTDITKGFNHCFSTGNWGVPKNSYVRQGVAQILSRLSYGATLSNLRRINIPVGKESKNASIRQINPSQIMFVCPAETPEGAPVGIVLNFSLLTRISQYTPTVLVKEVVELCDNIVLLGDFKGTNEYTKVFLNGIILGITDNPNDLVDELKKLRNVKMIPWDVSISYDEIDDEINIFSDDGRLLRPVFVVQDDHLVATEEDGTDWDKLVDKDVIRYIDNMEANSAVIAFHQKELSNYRNDYCEIAAAMMLGVMASIIPFPDHSQSPRNCYQAAMGKQAMSIFALSHLIRADTVVHVLSTPQKPLVSTRAGDMMGFSEMPSGINCVVAIACYTGYNQEDSVILNYSAIQRGLFWATTYRTHTEEEKKQGYITEKIGVPPLNKRRCDVNYGLLDDNGIVRLRHTIWTDEKGNKQGGGSVYVQKGDVIIGKIIIQTDKSGKEELNDCSLVIKKGEEGYIDRIFDTITPNGYRLVKVVIRKLRIPEIGDKFASRSAQKGTVGMVYRQEDMPWTQEGIVPDIIINPHCLTGDTVIQLSNGEVAYIKDIYDKDFEIVTIDPKTFKKSNSKYTNGFVKIPNTIIQLTTTSGRTLKCTPEHKWLVLRSGKICWVEASNIATYSDKIIVTHTIIPIPDDGGESLIIITNNSNSYWKKIKNIGLTGEISPQNTRILARLLGIVDSNGYIPILHKNKSIEKCFINISQLEDYEEICQDINRLGFSKPILIHQENFYRVEFEFALGVLLEYLGACIGNKNSTNRVFPKWILKSSLLVKREFLSGYHGGNGSKISINVNNSQQIQLESTKYRVLNIVKDSYVKYLNQIIELFREFGIITTLSISSTQYEDQIDLLFSYSNKPKNIILISDILDYRYCNHKRAESLIAIEYLRSHLNGFNMNYQHFTKCFQIGNYTGTFICDIKKIETEPVYDFTTISKNHNFIANGVISHNCIPSRMTINQLLECVLGKSCVLEGTYGDSTPFTSSSMNDENGTNIAEKLCKRLGLNGYERSGKEMLMNGMTGEPMGMFFIGPVYYQRLKHLVSDKIHARASGPVTTLTRQPLEGRSRDGGLRFGEMERDCMIGHGTSTFLQERLFTQSDKYSVHICEHCGNFATSKTFCQACETDKVAQVGLPYVGKLVLQELMAMMIKVKISPKN